MPVTAEKHPAARDAAGATPALWHEPAPRHFDLAFPWWSKVLLIFAATLAALAWLDYPIAHWALMKHPIADLADPKAAHNDIVAS